MTRYWMVAPPGQGTRKRGRHALAPYGLEIIESCLNCPQREDWLFCNLPSAAVERLAAITAPSTYPKGATLFVEGQSPRGVFVLCSGKVKLSTSSPDGRTLLLRISDEGEILGLSAAVCGKPYQATADILEPTQANFITRNDFLDFLREYGEAALHVAQQLGENYHHALSEMRTIGLSHSAAEKLAQFILEWCARHTTGGDEIQAKLVLTHLEIAQVIGASRETVTRLLSSFKKQELLEIKGSTITIRDKSGLERMAGR
jgi:CRP/FNR family transcriptional regulator, cyclic AMP receptor protein